MSENITVKSQSEHLKTLLQFVSANELRRSVQRVLFTYLLEQDTKTVDSNFKETVENHYFLIDFLDKIEYLSNLKEE